MLLFAAALLTVTGFRVCNILERSVGADFYQYWAIGLGPELSKGALKSPYVQLPEYVSAFDAQAKKTSDLRLFAVNKLGHRWYEKGLDIPGTPLLYALFGASSFDYSKTFTVFSIAKALLFVGATCLFLVCWQTKLHLLLPLSLAIAFGYGPLINDFRVGNLAALQYAIILALSFFLDSLQKESPRRFPEIFFISFLAFLVLVKPNILLVALALSAVFWRKRGGKAFVVSALSATFLSLFLIALPCIHYGSPSVWNDWLGYLSALESKRFYPIKDGNSSLTLALADALGTPPTIVCALVAFLLLTHVLYAVHKNRPAEVPRFDYAKAAISAFMQDAFLCVSAAIVVTLATSPLVWQHYYVLSLIPAFWLIAKSSSSSRLAFLALLSLALSSGLLPMAVPFFRKGAAQYIVVATAWMPLWFGIQTVVANRLKNLTFLKFEKPTDALSDSENQRPHTCVPAQEKRMIGK
ncbi:MAG: hypothetical protein PHW76_00660 [Alphaproteobacteria bacterium]|nr:hypothetical protein [Alphaproteobacteria bacterium]